MSTTTETLPSAGTVLKKSRGIFKVFFTTLIFSVIHKPIWNILSTVPSGTVCVPFQQFKRMSIGAGFKRDTVRMTTPDGMVLVIIPVPNNTGMIITEFGLETSSATIFLSLKIETKITKLNTTSIVAT